MLISIRHVTRYKYERAARSHVLSLRLTPPSFEAQRVLSWSIKAPGYDRSLRFRDGFGNIGHLASISEPHHEIVVEASGLIETWDRVGIARGLVEVAPRPVYLRQTPMTAPDEAIRKLAAGIEATDLLARLHSLMQRVRDEIDYEIGATSAHTTAAEALAEKKGVCQDHAQVFISAARVLGYPARYINGYYFDGGSGQSEASHAWAEAYVEGIGWVGFDATNCLCPTDHYVRVAWGLDAVSAAPVRGSRSGGEKEALDVVVEVQQQNNQQ
jgi:transglutaminase-like putative cysteine protease